MVRARESTVADVFALASNVRPEDLAEIKASMGTSVEAALMIGVLHSKPCLTIVDDNDGSTVLGMFGAVPSDEEVNAGAIWLIASKDLMDVAKNQFIRESRKWVSTFQEKYELLHNVVDARNEVHIKFLRWCGFTFLQKLEGYGVNGETFIEFARLK